MSALLGRALEWLDAARASHAIHTLGVAALRAPGPLLAVSSDLLRLSHLGLGEVRAPRSRRRALQEPLPEPSRTRVPRRCASRCTTRR